MLTPMKNRLFSFMNYDCPQPQIHSRIDIDSDSGSAVVRCHLYSVLLTFDKSNKKLSAEWILSDFFL